MNAAMKKWSSLAIALSVAGMVIVLGCGGDESGLASRYKVSGKVTYKGEPVGKGGVTFEPTKPPMPQGRVASGSIENGYYTLTTSTPSDGALPGEYKVIITASNLDIAELTKGQLLHQGDAQHVKALKAAKSLVPTKYTKGDSTPLTAKVEERSNTFDFDLSD